MLRQLRIDAGLTLRSAAEILRISESFLSLIEHGKRKPSYDLIQAFSELLSCDEDEIAISVGLVPRWFGEVLQADPRAAVVAAKDNFKKYGS